MRYPLLFLLSPPYYAAKASEVCLLYVFTSNKERVAISSLNSHFLGLHSVEDPAQSGVAQSSPQCAEVYDLGDKGCCIVQVF